jgi:hypothetical protein
MEMTFPGPVKIDALGGAWTQASGGDAEIIVYDGTTAMTNGTSPVDAGYVIAGNAREAYAQLSEEISLTANTTYRIAFKPTTTTNVTLYYFDVSDANHLQCHVGGTAWAMTSRLDSGAWAAPTTTRRPFLWPFVSSIGDDAGAGGGGGMIRHQGMEGGLNA